MVQASLPRQAFRFGPLARLAGAALLAAVLITGGLNLRPTLDRLSGADLATSNAPSDVDALVGGERPETELDAQIRALQDVLRQADTGSAGIAARTLGQAYLQKARENGDPAYYPKAEALFRQALDVNGEDTEALVGLGTLALARHQFAEALDWGERARVISPYHAPTYGVIADAQIELGRYDDAVETVQAMVDLRPDLRSYARVSYLRELNGDRDGAIVAMEQAAAAGSGYAENLAWVRVQLGTLRFEGGDLGGALHDYETALAARPGYAPAIAGQARVAAARGNLEFAAERYAVAVRLLPLPELVAAYGEVLEALGRPEDAAAQFALIDAMQRISAANGVDTDLELALFTADHGQPDDLPRAMEQARAAVAARPSVTAWDVLAWTLYQGGDLDGAAEASEEALHLGTRSALMHYHAGMIAAARGEREAAISHLETALAINPHFSVRYAPGAHATLARLRASEVIL